MMCVCIVYLRNFQVKTTNYSSKAEFLRAVIIPLPTTFDFLCIPIYHITYYQHLFDSFGHFIIFGCFETKDCLQLSEFEKL